jgi:hypothetical protein
LLCRNRVHDALAISFVSEFGFKSEAGLTSQMRLHSQHRSRIIARISFFFSRTDFRRQNLQPMSPMKGGEVRADRQDKPWLNMEHQLKGGVHQQEQQQILPEKPTPSLQITSPSLHVHHRHDCEHDHHHHHHHQHCPWFRAGAMLQ